MTNSTEKSKADAVTCNVCHQEVPHAESLTVEAQEYLFYFCGAGCYSRWEQLNGVVESGGSS